MIAEVLPVRRTYQERLLIERPRFTRTQISLWLGVSRDTIWVYENLIAKKAVLDFRKTCKPRKRLTYYHRWVLQQTKKLMSDLGEHEATRKYMFNHRENYSLQAFEEQEVL